MARSPGVEASHKGTEVALRAPHRTEQGLLKYKLRAAKNELPSCMAVEGL